MTTKLYMVTHGEYSNYHVVGVYSTMSNAMRIKNFTNSDRIEEITLDPAIDELNAGLKMFFVRMHFNGNIDVAEERPEDIESEYFIVKGQSIICNSVWAKDEVHAIKITNELRTKLIALGEL